MTDPPFHLGQVGLPEKVLRVLTPLDGRPTDDVPGHRLYALAKRWWVVLHHTEFGEIVVGPWGPLGSPGGKEVVDVSYALDLRHPGTSEPGA